MRKPIAQAEAVHLGFQIAPMIDVVFVIMLFFMAMAAAVKAERMLSLKLPGGRTDVTGMPPYEVSLGIASSGEISVNDGEVATADDHHLRTLKQTVERMGQQGEAMKSPVLVTIEAESQASYQRVIEVLNVLSAAGLPNVTFVVGDEAI